jgi:poly-beta-1,6-N-acetyl-D-glucosamine synthase
MVKYFIEPSKSRVIATGGVIRIANSCEIKNGKIVNVHVPKDYLPRAQALEYIRAFLLGRMAWSKLNGLMIISGAFGMFDKEILIKAGGYNKNTVGEDMELVVRMRRYMHEKREPYRVAYIPDPLCWTEAPSTYKMLGRQRNRWTRGIAETLMIHRKLFLNPKYGILGMISYPYWFIFEWLTPIIEATGLVYFFTMMFLDRENSRFFLALFLSVYTFSFMFSMFAILYEELSYNQYKKLTDILKLMLTAMVEPFVYHPLNVYWALQGNLALIRGKKDWGVMVRTGFLKPVKAKQK